MWIAIQNAIGARQGVGGGPGPGPGYTPPLDDYTGALVAYSMRKVRSAYSGPAIEAERFSDGATQDIEFDSNGLIDTTALTTFASGSIVGVRTWYDQSGNDNHAVQTAQGNQPRIYDGSNLYETESGKLYVAGSGNRWWELTTDITTAQSIFDSRITSLGTSTGANFLFGNTSSYDYHSGELSGQPIYLSAVNSATYVRNGDNYENGVLKDFTSYLHPLGSQVLISMFHTSASGRINELSRDRLGVPGARSWDGFWQETIIYGDNRSSIRAAFESNQNTYYQVTNLPNYSSGFLADYPGAAAAYSVRQLSNTAIKCMRVRRAVAPFDEQDIGFTAGGDLDEAAIVAFGGSDVLVVSAWYDQSGQSRHATQTTPGAQPQIYDGTAVVTENGKAGLYWGLTDDYKLTGSYSGTGAHSLFAVAQRDTDSFTTLTEMSPGLYAYSNANLRVMNNGNLLSSSYNIDTLQHSYRYIVDGINSSLHIDGSQLISGDAGSDSQGNIVVGSDRTGGAGDAWTGVIQEFILYPSNQDSLGNSTGIETNINDYFSIY